MVVHQFDLKLVLSNLVLKCLLVLCQVLCLLLFLLGSKRERLWQVKSCHFTVLVRRDQTTLLEVALLHHRLQR